MAAAGRISNGTLRGARMLLLALLCGAGIAAAAQAARVQGRVVDETGLPVANALVTWQGASGAVYRASTDAAGRFLSPVLPPGQYRITVEKQGFFRLRPAPETVTPGTHELQFTLNHEQELQQQVSVVSSANPVEPAENTRHETLVAQEIRDIPFPTSHDLRTALPALPGVVADSQGELHIAGGRRNDTEYLLDGFDISDPINGGLSANLNIDSVRSADIQPGRTGAEFAHSGAGVLALHTQMGDDHWRFGTTNFIPGPTLYQGLHFGNWYPRFTLSGPIRRGHAWFSDALSVQHTLDIVKELPRNANISQQWAGDNLLRAQFNLTPRQVLQANFLYNYQSDGNVGLGAFTPLSTTVNFGARRTFVSGRDQISVGSALLELGAAAEREHDESSPLGTALYVLHPVGASGNFFESQRQSAHRWQAVGDLLVPQREWHGTHDLQIGFNADWLGFTNFAARNPFEIVRADGSLIQQTRFSGNPTYALSDRLDGWFAQDSWQLNRLLRLAPGIRFDRSTLLHAGLAEPRIALSVLPFQDERAKFSVGWGVYAQPVDFSAYGRAFDQQREDVFFNAGNQPIAGPVTSRFELPAGGLAMPRFLITSAGWDQQIGHNTFAGLHFLRRQEHDGLAYDNLLPPATQPTGAQFLLANGRQDRYQDWEVSVRHSFRERAELFADYIRSHATSNQVFDYSLEAPVFTPQAAGPLAWDAPNRFISWGWAPVQVWNGLLLSYHLEYRTGFPFSVINNSHQVVGLPESQRFPAFETLDLGIEKTIAFRHHLWAVRLAIINVTDHQNPNVVVNNIDAANFLTFEGGQGRAFTGRIRLVGSH